MVKNGELIIKKCLINLNMLTRESQLVTCSVIADSGTTLSIESCEFRGSKHFNTIGVVLRNANMLMKNTSISNFMSGGIIMYTKPDNIVKIYKSRIRNNKYFGIQILGNSSSPSIQYCTIENNSCVGIQVCAANKCNIRKNIIILNKNGIEVISADPLIYENEINQNYANGIMVKSLENLVSLPKIQGNDIFSNSGNGILCMGMANKSHIAKNNITFNKKTGIHVMNSATVTILDNSISKNIFQGILIQENSSAHVERNKISSNIKANIAYGGEESCNTNIINNKITNGRCEGIFLIDCGKSMITRNEIKGNYYGILAITSIPTIMHN
jgi:F-box protein 11